MKVVSIVGMAGAGKSEVAKILERGGFSRIRFGDITDAEIKKRGLELNEVNERYIREQLRKERGMAAYAELSVPAIDSRLQSGDVVLDGVYSWEEYQLLKSRYKENFVVVAVHASPNVRYQRLAMRPVRPLTREEAVSRDISEIENTNKGGPIAMADYIIVNEASLEELLDATSDFLAILICR